MREVLGATRERRRPGRPRSHKHQNTRGRHSVRRNSSTHCLKCLCGQSVVGARQHDRQTICCHARLSEQKVLPLQNDHADRQRWGHCRLRFSLLQVIPLSPFSYADKAAQWSNNELIQLQVDGNKPIIDQAHIDENRGLSGLLIIPSSHLAEQMLRGRSLTGTTRAGARIVSIPTDAVKAFQQCANPTFATRGPELFKWLIFRSERSQGRHHKVAGHADCGTPAAITLGRGWLGKLNCKRWSRMAWSSSGSV